MTTPYHLHTDQRHELHLELPVQQSMNHPYMIEGETLQQAHERWNPQLARERQLALLERHLWRNWLLGFLAFILLLLAVVLAVGWLCWPGTRGAKAGEGLGKRALQVGLCGSHVKG